MQRVYVGWILAVATTAVTLGCGGDGRPRLVKVTGTVLLDGQPLEGAQVAFQPVTEEKDKFQRPSAGYTDASGKFVLGTYARDDGAPIGKFRVGILKREVVGKLPDNYNSEMEASTNLTYKWVTPRDLADPAGSGLTAEVTSSGLSPDKFEIKSLGQPEIEKTGPQRRANDP